MALPGCLHSQQMQPALETHTLEGLPVVKLHHCINLQWAVVGDLGILNHCIPLVELHAACQVLLVPEHHLIFGNPCNKQQ